jgi:hypothetical protein
MKAKRIVVCVAAAMAGACDPDHLPAPCHDDLEMSPRRAISSEPANTCPPNGCGGNSPLVDGVYFWRLHLPNLGDPGGGMENPEGVRITSVVDQGGTPMQLQLVEGDRLRGVDPVDGTPIAEHGALRGTQIRVSVKGEEFEILIDKVLPDSNGAGPIERFWIKAKSQIETYELRYRPLDSGIEVPPPLCSEGDGDPNKIHALVFGGEIYHPVTKTITAGPEAAGWINIACAGSALYKMHKIGHTSAAQARLQYETSPEQRRAMLNAWTANVCGEGTAFTEQGEPITLQESTDEFHEEPYDQPPHSIEAIWSHEGAVCLNVPRRWDDEPGLCTTLKMLCLPPPCTAEQVANWRDYGHVLTGNP